jgi:predicted PurR-regulated permease PerM
MASDTIISKKVIALIILLALLLLAFFIVRPFFVAIIFGFVLAFLLNPVYKKLNSWIKNPTVSSLIVCVFTVLVLAFGLYFLAQMTIKEAFNLYVQYQKIDFYSIVNSFLLKVFGSNVLASQITTTTQQAVITLTNTFMQEVSKLLVNAPGIILQLFVSLFVAYYSLKNNEKITNYIKEILPFDKETKERFITRSKELTGATVYGQVIVGIIQGAVAGIGFYVFGAPSPLLFTLLAIFLAIIPFIGPAFVWVPVSLIMMATGNLTNGVLMFIFGLLVVSWIDNIIKPSIVGKMGKVNQLTALIGMLGGIVLLGPVGLIIGPLALEYLVIFIDLYKRDGKCE